MTQRESLQKKNAELKAEYGMNAPSLPRVLREGNKELNPGHTESVLRGYDKRVYNFLRTRNVVGHVDI